MFCSIAVEMTTPLFISFVVDWVLQGIPPKVPAFLLSAMNALGDRSFYLEHLIVLGAGLLLFSLAGGVLMYLRNMTTALASETIAKRMRDRLYSHLQRWTYNDHVKAETGDLIQRCTSDVDTLRRFLSSQLVEMSRAVFLVGIALYVLIPISGTLTLVAVCFVPAIFLFSSLFFRLVIKRWRATEEAEGAMSATLQENLTGVRVVRAFGRQRFESDKFGGKLVSHRDLALKSLYTSAFYWSTSDLLCGLQVALVLGIGTMMAVRGQLTAGNVLLFVLYIDKLLWPIRQLGRILTDLGKSLVSLDRIGEILKKKTEADEEGGQFPDLRREIVFDDVCFHYDGGVPVLNHVSFTVQPGQTVAILGATGSGKSTLMHLLQRLYELPEGDIRIGGVSIREINKHHLRKRVGIVLQEPFLFSKTIRENVALARENPSEEEMLEACRVAHVDEFATGFEKGYDTVVGERGVTLSGGQKQRVAIARTLMKESDILIFDDSLSAVDTQTDASIREALKDRRAGLTTFIVSHRITTLKEADQILVLENGAIVQQGTHEQLLMQEGLYRRINDIQTSLEDELLKEADVPAIEVV